MADVANGEGPQKDRPWGEEVPYCRHVQRGERCPFGINCHFRHFATNPEGLQPPSREATQLQALPRLALAAAAAAATGAVLTTIIFYPVELIKNRLQASVPGGSFAYDGLVHGLRTVRREEGIAGLYAGFRSVLLRALAFDFSTVFWGELFVRHRRHALRAAQLHPPSSAVELALRTAGGCVTTIALLPLETVSTRVTVSRPSIGAIAAAKALWIEGGVPAFWRGLRVMLVLCLNPALSFTLFEQLKGLVLRCLHRRDSSEGRPAGSHGSEDLLSWSQAFLVGVVAKALTLCTVYPLIRGKFLLQARDTGQAGLLQVLRETIAGEGVRSLYRGLGAQLSKSLLSSALLLTIKERTETQWQQILAPPSWRA